jgi:ParB-like chromosome segregation protein Spo0J
MQDQPKISIHYRNIEELKPAEYNPRQMTKVQADNLRASIERYGVIDPLIVNTYPGREGVIVGGHMRFEIVKTLGLPTVPCVYVYLELEREKELNISLNRMQAEWDWDKLASFDDDFLKLCGFNDDELKRMSEFNSGEPEAVKKVEFMAAKGEKQKAFFKAGYIEGHADALAGVPPKWKEDTGQGMPKRESP